MILFKIIGMGLIILVGICIGFLKSLHLKKRAEKLCGICRSMHQLAELMHMGSCELERAVGLCFNSNDVYIESGRPFLNKNYLEAQDISLLNEFFLNLGMNDADAEYRRIHSFHKLILKQYETADAKSCEMSKLYKTLGFLCSLLVCIFLI